MLISDITLIAPPFAITIVSATSPAFVFIVEREPGWASRRAGEIITFSTPQEVEMLGIQLDFAKIPGILKYGQSITGVPDFNVYDDTGALSTDLVITDIAIASSLTYGTPNAAVNFTLVNVSGKSPAFYSLSCNIQLSGGSTILAGLGIQVEFPQVIQAAACP